MRTFGPDATATTTPQKVTVADKLHGFNVDFLQPDLRLPGKFGIGRNPVADVPGATIVVEEQ